MSVVDGLMFVQIVSESFPVSSSGHVELAITLLGRFGIVIPDVIIDIFQHNNIMYVLHTPTIIVLTIYYAYRWIPLLQALRYSYKTVARLIVYATSSSLISVMVYVVFKQFDTGISLSIGFLFTTMLLASLYWCNRSSHIVTMRVVCILGLVQGCAALVPGLSRLASVYVVARWLGVNSVTAFDVAWMIQIPLIGGAVLVGCYNLLTLEAVNDYYVSITTIIVLISAMISAYAGLAMMRRMAIKRTLWWVAWYMMLPLGFSIWVS